MQHETIVEPVFDILELLEVDLLEIGHPLAEE